MKKDVLDRFRVVAFCPMARLILSHMIKWFGANKLLLNLDKTNIMKFPTINSPCSTLHYIIYYIEETTKKISRITNR
jgi:hypothetical protein